MLEVQRDWAHSRKVGALAAEQKFLEVGGFAEHIQILLRDVGWQLDYLPDGAFLARKVITCLKTAFL